jgi:uroporphyrinogen-III synthase
MWPIVVIGLVIAGIALSPFWAPALAPLLPWGAGSTAPAYDTLAARLEAIEQRPVPPAIDASTIASAQSTLGRRLDQLEAARNGDRQGEATVASLRAGLQRLEQQLGANEAQGASREAREAAEMQKMQQELTRLRTASVDLADRFMALEQRPEKTQSTEAPLLVALLQIREAVEQGRPFAAELSSFAALAHDRPELITASAPLAEVARDGVTGRLTLAKRLADAAVHIANAAPDPPEGDWEAQVLARLRSLVTIRRIQGAPRSEPEAAVRAAEVALGRGDLGDAVAQLDQLVGANAEAAGPWLKMARQRLTVEAALTHLQGLLVIGLGHAAAAPARAPAETPAKPERHP